MRKEAGFTLIEMLTVVGVIGLLAYMATPSMNALLDKQRADAAGYLIVRQLNSARKFAVTSGQWVTFCGVDSNGVCDSEHIQQFAVFADQNYNQQIDDADEVQAYLDITYTGIVTIDAPHRHITFNTDGSARQFGSVILCPRSGQPRYNRRITVHRMGRPYLETDVDENGIVEETQECNS